MSYLFYPFSIHTVSLDVVEWLKEICKLYRSCKAKIGKSSNEKNVAMKVFMWMRWIFKETCLQHRWEPFRGNQNLQKYSDTPHFLSRANFPLNRIKPIPLNQYQIPQNQTVKQRKGSTHKNLNRMSELLQVQYRQI